LKTHSLTSYPLMPVCRKAVSLALSFTSFTHRIYQPPRTPLQPPLLTILQSWPQTLIQPSPYTSHKPAYLQSNTGSPNGD
jgi:hypothetical protein